MTNTYIARWWDPHRRAPPGVPLVTWPMNVYHDGRVQRYAVLRGPIRDGALDVFAAATVAVYAYESELPLAPFDLIDQWAAQHATPDAPPMFGRR